MLFCISNSNDAAVVGAAQSVCTLAVIATCDTGVADTDGTVTALSVGDTWSTAVLDTDAVSAVTIRAAVTTGAADADADGTLVVAATDTTGAVATLTNETLGIIEASATSAVDGGADATSITCFREFALLTCLEDAITADRSSHCCHRSERCISCVTSVDSKADIVTQKPL